MLDFVRLIVCVTCKLAMNLSYFMPKTRLPGQIIENLVNSLEVRIFTSSAFIIVEI